MRKQAIEGRELGQESEKSVRKSDLSLTNCRQIKTTEQNSPTERKIELWCGVVWPSCPFIHYSFTIMWAHISTCSPSCYRWHAAALPRFFPSSLPYFFLQSRPSTVFLFLSLHFSPLFTFRLSSLLSIPSLSSPSLLHFSSFLLDSIPPSPPPNT